MVVVAGALRWLGQVPAILAGCRGRRGSRRGLVLAIHQRRRLVWLLLLVMMVRVVVRVVTAAMV